MSIEKNKNITRFIVRAGIFSAMAAILYIAGGFIPFYLFSDFLQIHIDEIPAFIASFAYGPLMGVVVLAIKR